MIPKKIHFCWLSGDPYPPKIQYCIDSWEKYCPDYEIIKWDLNKFDIGSSTWCNEAFQSKKYAFAADFIRCYALTTEGGIYLDSDVEIFNNFDKFLHLPYFIGQEQGGEMEPAVIGSEPNNSFLNKLLDYYNSNHFITNSGGVITIPQQCQF